MTGKTKDELHDWQKAFKLKSPLLQVDVETFISALAKQRYDLLSKGAGHGATLRAAIAADWILEPPSEVGDYEGGKRYFYDGKNVDELHAGAVKWLGLQVDKAYQEATEIPKNL